MFPWTDGADFLFLLQLEMQTIFLLSKKLVLQDVSVSEGSFVYILDGAVFNSAVLSLCSGYIPVFLKDEIKFAGVGPLLYALLEMAAML